MNWTHVGIGLAGLSVLGWKYLKNNKNTDLTLINLTEDKKSGIITLVCKDGHGKTFAAYQLGGNWNYTKNDADVPGPIAKELTRLKDENISTLKAKVLRLGAKG